MSDTTHSFERNTERVMETQRERERERSGNRKKIREGLEIGKRGKREIERYE